MTRSLRFAVALPLLLVACTTADDVAKALRPDALAPRNLTAVGAVDSVAVDLAWAGDESATGYRVYRAEGKAALSPARFAKKSVRFQKSADAGAEISLATANTTTYTDKSVKAGITYLYRVTALSESGAESAPSNLASSKPGPQGPAPTALAIAAAKNVTETTQVVHNDPRPKMTHTYTIATPPTTGTATINATGLVSYTPALNYEGKASMKVTVTAADKRSGEVTIPITVGNRAPSPIAKSIAIEMNGHGTTQVLAGDPDRADTHTFAIVTGPGAGSASIDAGGLVNYVPQVNFSGETSIVVAVTDNSGAVGNTIIGVNVGGPVPSSVSIVPGIYCNDGGYHVTLTSISLPLGSILAPNTDYNVTAVVSYAIASAQSVGIRIGGTYITQVVSGCGSVEVSGTFNSGAGTNLGVRSYVVGFRNWYEGNYLVTATPTDMPELGLVSTTFPSYSGVLLDDIQYEWSATYLYNVNRSNGIWSTFWEIDEATGQGNWYPYMSPINVGDYTRTVRLRAMPACGDDHIEFQAYLSNDISPDVYNILSVPIAPPIFETYDFYTSYPLLNADQTVQIDLGDCMGNNPTVELVPSSDFFSVDQATVTLPATIWLTYHADKVSVGQLSEGVLQIISTTGDFSTKTLPVSAQRFDYDLSQWTWADCTIDCGTDDGERTIPLPFVFPAGGVTTTVIYASTNGALFFGEGAGNYSDYGNMDASFDLLDPTYFDVAFVAFFWTDNRIGWGWNYADNRSDYDPGIYYRDMGDHVEILYWDFFSYSSFTNRQVMLHKIYPDGHVMLTYPMINPTGIETAGAFTPTGRAIQMWDVSSISNGTSLNVSPIPAN